MTGVQKLSTSRFSIDPADSKRHGMPNPEDFGAQVKEGEVLMGYFLPRFGSGRPRWVRTSLRSPQASRLTAGLSNK